MSPRSYSRLTLLLLLIFASAAVWVWWPAFQDSGGDKNVEEVVEESLDAASQLEDSPAADAIEGIIQRTEFVDPVIAMTENLELGYPPERDILVRAELTLIEEEQGHPPKNCEGWEVVAQTWIVETGEIARFYATSDKKGIAEFHFPDFIHVDWVMCLPPEGSGYAVTFFEGHDDLGPDDNYLVLLHVEESKGAFGHVQNTQGQPVAGAVVHAYDEGWTYGLDDWTPGFLTTTTDHNGRFTFAQLSPATWAFAVEPEQWLMMEPVLGRQQEGVGMAEIEDDTTEEVYAGILKVVPMVLVELQMMGSNGTPAVGANLFLQPLTLDDSSLPTIDNLPYNFHFTSDREGKVTLRLLRGRYLMQVAALPGMHEGDENPPYEFHTDQGKFTYRFHAPLSDFHGTVVGNDGTPMHRANVQINWRIDGDERGNDDRECDATGQFLFQSIRLGNDFEVHVWPGSDAWLPLTMPLSQQDFGGDLELVLAPASKMLLHFDMEVLPDRVAHFKVLRFTPLQGEGFDSEDQWWRNCEKRTYHINKRNRANVSWVQAGTYEIAISHSPVGYRKEEGVSAPMIEVQRLTVETSGAWQEIKVDWPR